MGSAIDLLLKCCYDVIIEVSYGVVAAQAGELPLRRCRVRRLDSVDNFLMTVAASLLGDLPAVRFDLNVVLVAARGEKERMPEAVGRLVAYLPMKFAGVWQLLQVATARCDDLSQPSNCSRMTWQLAQAAGSSVI